MRNSLTVDKSISLGAKIEILRSFDKLKKDNDQELDKILGEVQQKLKPAHKTIFKMKNKMISNPKIIILTKLQKTSVLEVYPLKIKMKKNFRTQIKKDYSGFLPNVKCLLFPKDTNLNEENKNKIPSKNLSTNTDSIEKISMNSSFSTSFGSSNIKIIKRPSTKKMSRFWRLKRKDNNSSWTSLDTSMASIDSLKPSWLVLPQVKKKNDNKSTFSILKKTTWFKNKNNKEKTKMLSSTILLKDIDDVVTQKGTKCLLLVLK